MRLLNTTTGEFQWFNDPKTIRYAILSHVWEKDPVSGALLETTYQDIEKRRATAKTSAVDGTEALSHLPEKVRNACRVARDHGFQYIWIDSCCIDKTNSSELFEAINLMFEWYRRAQICYVYLIDVDNGDNPSYRPMFRRSAWFNRGWTLQELLAPAQVLFYSKGWDVIGAKHELATTISQVTMISPAVLRQDRQLEDVCVAERMSWACNRDTSKEEDKAYCLLGIFGVNMSPNYGEGSYAFIRLQKMILEQIPDQSILAWGSRINAWMPHQPINFNLPNFPYIPPAPSGVPQSPYVLQSGSSKSQERYLLALSPQDFIQSNDIKIIPYSELATRLSLLRIPYPKYSTTPHGIRMTLPLIMYSSDAQSYFFGFLACTDRMGRLLALILQPDPVSAAASVPASNAVNLRAQWQGAQQFLSQQLEQSTISKQSIHVARMAAFSSEVLNTCHGRIQIKDVYIQHRISPNHNAIQYTHQHYYALYHIPEQSSPFDVTLSRWCVALLKIQGYEYKVTESKSRRGAFTLARGHDEPMSFTVEQCTECDEGRKRGSLRATVTIGDSRIPPLHSSTTLQDRCSGDHIRTWSISNGFPSGTFGLPSAPHDPLATTQQLRLALKHVDVGVPSRNTYVLDINIYDSLSTETGVDAGSPPSKHTRRRRVTFESDVDMSESQTHPLGGVGRAERWPIWQPVAVPASVPPLLYNTPGYPQPSAPTLRPRFQSYSRPLDTWPAPFSDSYDVDTGQGNLGNTFGAQYRVQSLPPTAHDIDIVNTPLFAPPRPESESEAEEGDCVTVIPPSRPSPSSDAWGAPSEIVMHPLPPLDFPGNLVQTQVPHDDSLENVGIESGEHTEPPFSTPSALPPELYGAIEGHPIGEDTGCERNGHDKGSYYDVAISQEDRVHGRNKISRANHNHEDQESSVVLLVGVALIVMLLMGAFLVAIVMIALLAAASLGIMLLL